MNPPAFSRSSLLRIALALAVVFAVVFATVKQAGVLLGQALSGAFGTSRVEYRSVWFDWSGNVTARHVVLRPAAGEEELRFDRAWLATPGWGFFLRHAFDRNLQGAAWPHLHLVLADLQEHAALPALVPGLGPVGPASGAMLEAAGCRASRGFDREALTVMGLVPAPALLEIDERLDGTTLTRVAALEVRGSSRTQFERSGTLDAPRTSLLGERATARIASERWRVRDQGFVPARNRHCAASDGVPLREFPERHIEAVDAYLQRAGLAADENARAFYRRFARSGGEMSFGGEYQPPLSPQEAVARNGRAFARMNATLERDTRAVPIVWRQVEVVPGPEAARTVSHAGPGARSPSSPADAARVEPRGADAARSTASADTPVATRGETPAETPVGTPVEVPAEQPVDTPVDTSAEPSVERPMTPAQPPVTTPADPAPSAVVTPPTTPPPAASTTPATPAPPSSQPPRVAAPTPETPPRNTTPRIERAPPATRSDWLAWDDLANHRGRRIRLWTVHNPPRTVELLAIEGDTARVRARLGGGNAEYSVQRSGFLKAKPIR